MCIRDRLYLANLKKAVHWTVKLTYVDMLAAYAKAHGEEAFHIATHLSNLLSVSEHLPVRERAGQALVGLCPLLRADQRNEIVIDLIRELESGQDPVARYIPPFLGDLICSLPAKEMAECTDLLEAMVRSSNIRPARFALSTLGAMLRQVYDQPLGARILGLLLTGIAHYENSIHRTALYVLCKGYLAEASIPLEQATGFHPLRQKAPHPAVGATGRQDYLFQPGGHAEPPIPVHHPGPSGIGSMAFPGTWPGGLLPRHLRPLFRRSPADRG